MTGQQSRSGGRAPAPEGGWGWAVAAGLAATLIVSLGPQVCFGQIFGEFLEGLGEGTRGITLITSVNMALHSFTGLLANYALKTYSCRQVALVGACMFFTGNVLTVFANSVFHMILTFAILPGVGLGLMLPASYTSFNSYFSSRRVPVMGATQTVLSAGMMGYPLLVHWLVATYGFRIAQGVVAALTAFAIAGALTYLPVGGAPSCLRRSHADDPCKELPSPVANGKLSSDLLSSKSSQTGPQLVANGKLVAEQLSAKRHDGSEPANDQPLLEAHHQQHSQVGDARSVEEGGEDASRMRRAPSQVSVVSVGGVAVIVPEQGGAKPNRSVWRSVYEFLDLGLLRDPVYIILNLGVSLAFYSDFTFTTLLPLFLVEGAPALEARDAAACLTVAAACDVLGRVVYSLYGACARATSRPSSRAVFLVGSACIVVARTVMVYVSGFTVMAIICGVLGFFRSWIHITFSLVFAEYCSIERFPSAYGLYMAVSGVIGMATGPLVGVIRDVTDSYPVCIHSLNVQMMLCVIPWSLEMVVRRMRRKNEEKQENRS